LTSKGFRAAREALGMTQLQLAKALGMKTDRQIRRMEKGKSPIHKRTEVAVEKLLSDRGLALSAQAKEADNGEA
jgi:transcriptional regulator with XRE-family HTH domain